MKTLFIIGAQRSGTTFLKEILSLNNKLISINSKEEPKTFFRKKFPTNLGSYLSHHDINTSSKMQDEGLVILEKSTSYYEHIHTAKRIKDNLPKSKIIFVARDPFERLISNYEFSKKNNLETLDFNEAILNKNRKFETSVNPFDYLSRSLYSQYLIFWENIFKDNFKLIIFEEMITSPSKTAKDICSWLDMDFNDSFLNQVKAINPKNTLKRSQNKYDFGDLEKAIKFLFDSEKKYLEGLLGRPINTWSF